jgi:hypothetical protein
MWKLFQLAVFFGVFALFVENDLYKGYGIAPVFLAGLSAFLATLALSGIFWLLRRGKALLFPGH